MKDYKLDELIENICKWADARGIFNGSLRTQLIKLISEMGELADASIKDDKKELADAFGDMCVVMVSVIKLALNLPPYLAKDTIWRKFMEAFNNAEFNGEPVVSEIDFANIITTSTYFINRRSEVEVYIDRILKALYTYAKFRELDIIECIESAYNEIKDRKGKTLPNGNFVKEV